MPHENLLVAGRYRMEAVIGDGGMGRVWRAYDETLGRPVAVKEVHFPPDVSVAERAALSERTMREARITAQLSHPAVVTTYDAVVEAGRPFIVMELVACTSLAQRITDHGALPQAEVRRIGLTLLDALEAAHRSGIAHRDVKPSNVLLADDGRVLLSDFGIAVRDSDPSLTGTGLLIGSPAYMSPERLRGERAGFGADVWSVGATLYAALEGRPPFLAETTMGTITAILTDAVAPPDVHGPLADAVLGMLVKEREARLTLGQARHLLTTAEPAATAPPRTVPVPAGTAARAEPGEEESWWTLQPPGPGVVPVPTRRRRTLPVAVVAGAVVLAALGLAGVWLAGPGAEDESAAPGPASGRTTAGPSASPEPSPSPSPTRDETRTATPRARSVPAGFRMHRDRLGFRVAVPRGWERSLDGPTRVDFVAPSGDRFVRIDQRAHALPDAAEAWRDAEPSVADSLDGYRRIRIDDVPHPRWDVADWEFTWRGGSGRIHVLNRGIATDTRGFALYVSAPHDSWGSEGARLFGVVSNTFRPTA